MSALFRRIIVTVALLCAIASFVGVNRAQIAGAAPTALSGNAVAQVAYNAGFRGYSLDVAVAIARAESGWNASAVGDYGTSIGLWQIHLPAHAQYSRGALFNSQTNANAAFAISSGGRNFAPWSTFTHGLYIRYLAHYAIAGPKVVDAASVPAPRVSRPVPLPRVITPHVAAGSLYRIVWGDTLWAIAKRFGTSIGSLARLNGIRNPNLIYAGAILRIR